MGLDAVTAAVQRRAGSKERAGGAQMDAARPSEQDAGGGSERNSPVVGGDTSATRVVSFREKSTYRSDPDYTASGVRQYVNDQLYPHLLAAMQAINTMRPQHPVMFMARCLLEGSAPDDEPTAGAHQIHVATSECPLLRQSVWSYSRRQIAGASAAPAAGGDVASTLPLLSDQVQGPLQDAITACVKEKPRPPDPVRVRHYWS